MFDDSKSGYGIDCKVVAGLCGVATAIYCWKSILGFFKRLVCKPKAKVQESSIVRTVVSSITGDPDTTSGKNIMCLYVLAVLVVVGLCVCVYCCLCNEGKPSRPAPLPRRLTFDIEEGFGRLPQDAIYKPSVSVQREGGPPKPFRTARGRSKLGVSPSRNGLDPSMSGYPDQSVSRSGLFSASGRRPKKFHGFWPDKARQGHLRNFLGVLERRQHL